MSTETLPTDFVDTNIIPPPFDADQSEPTAEDYAKAAKAKLQAEQDAEQGKLAAIEANRDEMEAIHEAAVKEITGLIVSKLEDEGTRNFSIGKRAFVHARWQRDNYGDGFEAGDLDNMMNRIRDAVRIHVMISPKAIKIGEWLRCHILRELVAEVIGEERAKRISFFEYRTLYGSALAFDKRNIAGTIKDGWMELIRAVVSTRESGKSVSSEAFMKLIKETETRIAASKVTANPEAAALKVASDAIKAEAKAKTKANEDITTSISDAIGGNHITPESVMGILETVVKHHGAEMPKSTGFDPAACTMADCDTLVRAMRHHGKLKEMKRLRFILDAAIDNMDKAAEKTLAMVG